MPPFIIASGAWQSQRGNRLATHPLPDKEGGGAHRVPLNRIIKPASLLSSSSHNQAQNAQEESREDEDYADNKWAAQAAASGANSNYGKAVLLSG